MTAGDCGVSLHGWIHEAMLRARQSMPGMQMPPAATSTTHIITSVPHDECLGSLVRATRLHGSDQHGTMQVTRSKGHGRTARYPACAAHAASPQAGGLLLAGPGTRTQAAPAGCCATATTRAATPLLQSWMRCRLAARWLRSAGRPRCTQVEARRRQCDARPLRRDGGHPSPATRQWRRGRRARAPAAARA